MLTEINAMIGCSPPPAVFTWSSCLPMYLPLLWFQSRCPSCHLHFHPILSRSSSLGLNSRHPIYLSLRSRHFSYLGLNLSRQTCRLPSLWTHFLRSGCLLWIFCLCPSRPPSLFLCIHTYREARRIRKSQRLLWDWVEARCDVYQVWESRRGQRILDGLKQKLYI